MQVICPICNKVFSRQQNLKLHMMVHKNQQNNPTPTPSDVESRLSMLEDVVEVATTGSQFLGKAYNNPYLQQPQQPIQPVQEDSFDKMLKQYMQIMMIKQLSQATNSNGFTDLIKFQQFLDGREPEEEDENPLLNALISQFAPQIQGLVTKKKVEVSDLKLPTEEEFLKMSNQDIVKLLLPYRKQIEQLKLTQDQAYQNILNYYPHLTEDRFNQIWGLLNG